MVSLFYDACEVTVLTQQASGLSVAGWSVLQTCSGAACKCNICLGEPIGRLLSCRIVFGRAAPCALG